MNMPPAIAVVAIVMVFMCWATVMIAVFLVGRTWARAFFHGTPVPFFRILGMRLRGAPSRLLVDAYVTLRRDGSTATLDDVERAFRESGNGILSCNDLVDVVNRYYTNNRPRPVV